MEDNNIKVETKINMFDHLLIIDVDTQEVLENRRGTMTDKKSLDSPNKYSE